jgi:hypothetical protein
MAPGEAVELGGLRNNSLAVDNAPPGAAGLLCFAAQACFAA